MACALGVSLFSWPYGTQPVKNALTKLFRSLYFYTGEELSGKMGSAKKFRHGQILRLVTSERIANQEDLRRRLSLQRLRVTQATLSRDLVEEIAPMPTLARALGEFLLDIRPAENLLVLKTPPSGAQPLAAAVDGAKFPEIAGTIAGDDTVLIITPTRRQRESLQHKIESFVGRPLSSRAS